MKLMWIKIKRIMNVITVLMKLIDFRKYKNELNQLKIIILEWLLKYYNLCFYYNFMLELNCS